MPTKVTTRYPHEPDYAVPPGETLAETIAALGMDHRELSVRAGLSKKLVDQIIGGHAAITHKTAEKLERVTGVPARMWNNLETNYRKQLSLAPFVLLRGQQKKKDWIAATKHKRRKKGKREV